MPETRQKQVLEIKAWGHPAPHLTFSEWLDHQKKIGNTVLEVHEECGCIGALNPPERDNHALLAVGRQERYV